MADGTRVASVEELLATQRERYKSVNVQKDIGIQVDVGSLLISDVNVLDTDNMKRDVNSYLKNLTRENTQLLLNEVWKLPAEVLDDVVIAQLPKPTTVLPREKPIPKPKPPTKWELYAKKKGLLKKKRSRMVFDEKSGEWKPRWGYKRINDPKEDWLIEVPQNSDPFEDQFEKRAKDKSERVAKNEYQRLRNLAKSQDTKITAPSTLPSHKNNKYELSRAIKTAKKATASAGVFQNQLAKEGAIKVTGKKRKFAPVVGDMVQERERTSELFEKLQRKHPLINMEKAVNKQLEKEQRSPKKRKTEGKKSKTQLKKMIAAKKGKKGSKGKKIGPKKHHK